MTSAPFGRVMTAMVTPFEDDGAFDPEAAAKLAQWLVANGNDGLVLAGTTGESPTITADEQIALFEAVRAAVDVPLVGGTGGNDTRHSVALTERAADVGLDGILVVTPYYNRPSQAGLRSHFRALCETTDLPVMIYDIPVRTGRKISTDLLIELATEVGNVAALKDAAGNPGETAKVIAAAPDLAVYSGDDPLTLPLLAVGAVGVVGVATHWCGTMMGQMIEAFMSGDVAGAAELNTRMIESFAFETGDDAPNPLPAKAMMRTLGHAVGQARLPMGEAPPGLEDEARAVFARLNG
ncbi:MAG TPA: 4-hydroxy-tetrahydrodipicolinate synthase [Acidimicrobiales bacterium]|nr:4-hydroxy-tetrahydrodipicolinate synthase [Acidimicrobiales bacterium]